MTDTKKLLAALGEILDIASSRLINAKTALERIREIALRAMPSQEGD